MSTIQTKLGRSLIVATVTASFVWSAGSATAATAVQQNIAGFASEAKAQDKNFKAFSAERGRILFTSRPATGKPDTPSCTSCHTKDPRAVGQTRAGKEIKPMALSRTPDRFSDIKKVKKWFRRNCKSVIGRVCTALEKGDFLTFMVSQ